jgi:hypothetical protein
MDRKNGRLSSKHRIATLIAALCLLAELDSKCFARKSDSQRLEEGGAISWVDEQPNGDRFLNAKIKIHADLRTVWDAIRSTKDSDLRSSQVSLQVSANERIVLEDYKLPVLGWVWCHRRIVESPYKRIDFKMIDSNHFRALEGHWILTPAGDGKSVYIEFSSHVKIDRWAPRSIFESVGKGKIERLVRRIRDTAEKRKT